MLPLRSERGVALALALFALVVIGVLVAGGLFAGTQEQRAGENVRRAHGALGAAEGALLAELRAWTPPTYAGLRPFPLDTVTVGRPAPRQAPGGTGWYAGRIYKLNDNLYLLDMAGAERLDGPGAGGGARQRLGLLARVRPLPVTVTAALTTSDGVRLGSGAGVDGSDHVPPGWTDCPPPDTGRAGVRTGGSVTRAGNAVVAGDPPVVWDSTLRGGAVGPLGGLEWNELVARATVVLPPGSYRTQPDDRGGVCDPSPPTNWGDGARRPAPCGDHVPIIHVEGSGTTVLAGGQGQGVLLVDGSLHLRGRYEFFGLVIVRGDLTTARSSDAAIWGAAWAGRAELDGPSGPGRAAVNYSKCVTRQVLRATARLAPVQSRGWVQLY